MNARGLVEALGPIEALPKLPAGHPLTSAWAKFARACEHFDMLRTVAHEIVEGTLANGALIRVSVPNCR
jgi:hypothetical protein